MKSGMEEENVSMFDEPRRKQIVNVVDMLDVLGTVRGAQAGALRQHA